MGLNGYELIEYACSRFEEEKYDEALEGFVLAYMKGIEKDWVLENIYNCYMQGNEQEFQDSFDKFKMHTNISYEQCLLDFVPYKEGEYYIFDKEEKIFRGSFSVAEFEKVPSNQYEQIAFSAFAVVMGWDWIACNNLLTEAKHRKIYVISEDIQRMSSFFKLPELQEYVENMKVFSHITEFQKYFHKNTSIYLPHAVAGSEEEKKELLAVIEEEHQYRLTPEGRNIDNVLFTIGIPTHARGNLLLKRLENLREMPYDAEVEFAISKNGNLFYEDEYASVNKIEDARINYYDHGKELEPEVNWHYTVEMAHGKYVLLISDEDDVCLGAVEHYLKLFIEYPEAVIIRAKSKVFYSDINERVVGAAGVEAFGQIFLYQNYLSGLIVRRDIFLAQEFMKLNCFKENEYYKWYVHDWWCSCLSLEGPCINEPVQLVEEQKTQIEEERQALCDMGIVEMEDMVDTKTNLPNYSSYEGRFKQFDGEIEFLHMLEVSHEEVVPKGLEITIEKLAFLIALARKWEYKVNEFEKVVDEFVNISIAVLDEFQLSDEYKHRILLRIKQCVLRLYYCHDELCEKKRTSQDGSC